MIVDFTVENFRSFKNQEILSAEAGERLRKYNASNTLMISKTRLLKNLLLFGPNGSGKSNMLIALKLMKQMILNDPVNVTQKLPYQPFAFSNDQGKPTLFQIDFFYEDTEYQYRFSYNAEKILSESLKIRPPRHSKFKVYFERSKSKDFVPQSLRQILKQTKQNSLLLYNAQKNNDQPAINVMKWFSENLIFFDDFQVNENMLEMVNQPDIKNAIIEFLQFADFNIEDVTVEKIAVPPMPQEFKKILNQIGGNVQLPTTQSRLFTIHKVYDANGKVVGKRQWDLNSESLGTQKIFLIALALLYARKYGDNKTLIFDEFDDSLHVELSKNLVRIFNSTENMNQIISTTHELQLLDQNLRVDQIYLFEKDFEGISTLDSIFDFDDSRNKGRTDIGYMKRYIKGKYGAYPQIELEEMQEALKGVEKKE
ncbi:AAA family ATPase [Ligilactobacillus aviarius]|uniref:AAA family ATPase n=1 Tax=Ligilactobacillus aviarius TaxID=1606 RepID=UPI0024B909B4|nr:ATP-binding protein [Ligilactobacillus aviarius]